jgi:hypothetical protein
LKSPDVVIVPPVASINVSEPPENPNPLAAAPPLVPNNGIIHHLLLTVVPMIALILPNAIV